MPVVGLVLVIVCSLSLPPEQHNLRMPLEDHADLVVRTQLGAAWHVPIAMRLPVRLIRLLARRPDDVVRERLAGIQRQLRGVRVDAVLDIAAQLLGPQQHHGVKNLHSISFEVTSGAA
jgi:hypothetical protein